MTFEVSHGETVRYVQQGNPYAACLNVLKDEAKGDALQTGPFVVTRLPDGDTEEIAMEVVLRLQYLALNGEGPDPPPVNLYEW
jgi:hypothetical protein